MSREIDRRDFNPRRTVLNRTAELRSLASAVSDRLPGAHRIRIARFDGITGNPAAMGTR
jgi:extracellular elastinolytic metalloproteinase